MAEIGDEKKPTAATDIEKHGEFNGAGHERRRSSVTNQFRGSLSVQHAPEDAIEGQIFSMNDVDPVLDAKMRLVNQAIEEIGWTNFQLKLFMLSGFGYAADSLILLLQSITAGQAALEFQPSFTRGLTVAAYTGMLVGALFWGLSADVIGRKFAFNTSLFLCSVFAIVAGASPNWIVLGLFVSLAAFGAGGNLVLDATVFLEYLPSKYQWLLTLMACWWGIAPVVAAGFAWPLLSLPQYICAEDADPCRRQDNMGWRYIWFGNGALVLFMSVARVTVVRLRETPKFSLAKGDDAQVVETFQYISQKYNRPCSLTLEKLEACGHIKVHGGSKYGTAEFMFHLKGLFQTKRLGISTGLIWFSWTLIGLAYPLFYVFLPEFLETRGAETGEGTPYYVWRNYLITNSVSIFGPVLAGFMCNWKYLGRRYTMVIGALITMAFFFAYTAVRTPSQNLGFTCAIYFSINIYYGCLYAYTPEVLPSAHRTTGYGIAIGCNRVMGLISAFVATYANTATSAPIYLCAALYIGMAATAIAMPFEPFGRQSM